MKLSNIHLQGKEYTWSPLHFHDFDQIIQEIFVIYCMNYALTLVNVNAFLSLTLCRANQWTNFYMIGTSAMKEFKMIWSTKNFFLGAVRKWNGLL